MLERKANRNKAKELFNSFVRLLSPTTPLLSCAVCLLLSVPSFRPLLETNCVGGVDQDKKIGVVGIGQDIAGRLSQERKHSELIDTANAPTFEVVMLGQEPMRLWTTIEL